MTPGPPVAASPGIEQARAFLKANFGYPDFRPGQTDAVISILQGRDTLIVLPTGGGKSLCYQIPALVMDGLTVVISPLISLMKDQVDALLARGLPATFLNSTISPSENSSRIARVLAGEIKLLYVAPERFDAGALGRQLRTVGVRLLAVDEAHCISEWGHDFRPSYLRVKHVRTALGSPPTVALTATATPEVRSDIARQLELKDPNLIITGFDRTNLSYYVIPTRDEAQKTRTLTDLLSRQKDGVSIVYASTRRTVQRLASVLGKARIPATAYHAGLDDKKRAEAQDAFMKERTRVIVATNAFGMGIDKPNVRLVVHHSMPGTLESYYQEAGRGGRDRNPATAVLLHSYPDRFTHEFFINGTLPDRKTVEDVYNTCVNLADPSGLIEAPFSTIAALTGTKANVREVESAIRILSQNGMLAVAAPDRESVLVRLLATPQRIRSELGSGNQGLEIALLRSLWKRAGEDLYKGIVADVSELPPGLGGSRGAAKLLESLEKRQFVTWKLLGAGLYLVKQKENGSGKLSGALLDWESLERRRRSDLYKLEMMQKYAYTRECRRTFVLRYFGDNTPRGKCTGCDNCLGVKLSAT